MSEAPAAPLTVDVVSDVVCPWCFIGKRRLEAALVLAARDGAARDPIVRWHPFELNPDLPREGIDRRAYLDAKFGGAQRAAEIYERVRAAGASVGIPFAFERIARQPNTRDAHRLVAWTQGRGNADALVERLFTGYFQDGRNPGDRDVLAAIAGEAGGDAAAARAMLDSDEGEQSFARPSAARSRSASAACRSSSSTGGWRYRERRNRRRSRVRSTEAVRTPGPTAAKA